MVVATDTYKSRPSMSVMVWYTSKQTEQWSEMPQATHQKYEYFLVDVCSGHRPRVLCCRGKWSREATKRLESATSRSTLTTAPKQRCSCCSRRGNVSPSMPAPTPKEHVGAKNLRPSSERMSSKEGDADPWKLWSSWIIYFNLSVVWDNM